MARLIELLLGGIVMEFLRIIVEMLCVVSLGAAILTVAMAAMAGIARRAH